MHPTPSSSPPVSLRDRFGRSKRKLRVSLTDRCNFRCPYCMPEHPQFMERKDRLSTGELRRLLSLFVHELGIGHLRLTGGEPLLRRDLEAVIADCQPLRSSGLQRVSLTTNGALLASRVAGLRAAGLNDANVSLDAIDETIFRTLSGGRSSRPVFAGIEAAQAAGLPLKINAVIVRGANDQQILPLVRWAMHQRLILRFIEFMPLDGRGEWSKARVFSEKEILAQLREHFHVTRLPRDVDPASGYLLDGHFTVGIISTITNPFCGSCDRLRLTAAGDLYACLFSQTGPNLRDQLRRGATDAELLDVIRRAVWNKDAGYATHPGYVERPLTMHSLGG